jgi:FAD/FMN-containing dehydrogenase
VAGGPGGDGRQVGGDTLTGLARQLRGELLLPGDPGYDDARQGYNSLHDRRPAVAQAGERVLDAFRVLAPPIADLLRPMPYPAMYELIPEAPRSVTNVTYSFVADELDDEAIGSILERLEEPNLPSTEALAAVELRVLGGAIAQVPVDATAFAHRRRNLLCSVVAAGFPEADAERHRGWVRSLSGAIGRLAKGAYPNFADAADEARLHEAYPDGTYRRLVEVKRRYDPANLFHRNLNVRPHPDGL